MQIPLRGGFPHSEIVGYNVFCQLPNAYRRLTRPSSPLTAKASTVYALSLNHTTPNPLLYVTLPPQGRAHEFGVSHLRLYV